jgi:hypothetical protein
MKKQKNDKILKPANWKSATFKPKGKPGKSRAGKQGSIRSGGGKRN